MGDVTVSSAVQSLILEIDDWDYFKANLREVIFQTEKISLFGKPPAQTVATKVRIDRYMEMSRAWSIISQRLVSGLQEECKSILNKKNEISENFLRKIKER